MGPGWATKPIGALPAFRLNGESTSVFGRRQPDDSHERFAEGADVLVPYFVGDDIDRVLGSLEQLTCASHAQVLHVIRWAQTSRANEAPQEGALAETSNACHCSDV